MRKSKGITLIALVVTIIVLLILAGISIAMLTGTNGILTRASDAKNENVKGTEREQISLAFNAEKSIILEKGNNESVKAEDLESRLQEDGAKITSVGEENDSLKVAFETGNIYDIDQDGNITDGVAIQPVSPPVLGEVEPPQSEITTELGNPCGVIEIAWLDLNNNVIAKPLSPTLGNMEKIAWGDYEEVTPTSNSEWYDYNSNQWANAKNPDDGSYFVWIPRYAYKIIYFDTDANKNAYIADKNNKTGIVGYSTIYGMTNTKGEVTKGTETNITDTVKTQGYRDYIPHPGFLGTGYEDLGGGFGTNNKGIRGIWVAKFEMSREDSIDNGATWNHIETSSVEIGNVATKNAGSNNFIRTVSKPGVTSWRNINIANSYENAYHYDRSRESHLMKNSEWGAAVYLAHSVYGRNGIEVTANDRADYCTGGGVEDVYIAFTNQSSTNNPYGVYDLNGNAFEYVAVFNRGYTNGWFYGSSFYSEKGKFFASNQGASTKYATTYDNNTSYLNVDFKLGDLSHPGEAVREVYDRSIYGWFGDSFGVVNETYPFLIRGGLYRENGRYRRYFYC